MCATRPPATSTVYIYNSIINYDSQIVYFSYKIDRKLKSWEFPYQITQLRPARATYELCVVLHADTCTPQPIATTARSIHSWTCMPSQHFGFHPHHDHAHILTANTPHIQLKQLIFFLLTPQHHTQNTHTTHTHTHTHQHGVPRLCSKLHARQGKKGGCAEKRNYKSRPGAAPYA